MKKITMIMLLLIASTQANLSFSVEVNDLDLIILQNPAKELKQAAKKGQLEKLVRIIRLIEQNKVNLNIFQDHDLVTKAEKREVKNNRDSKAYLGFKGFLWAALIATALVPAGATKWRYYAVMDSFYGLDYFPVMMKAMFLMMELWFLHLTNTGKKLFKRDGLLVKQLVKKYHEKSLAIQGAIA